MIDFMDTLGISHSQNIPFLRMFQSREELKEEFIKFSPRTFTYGSLHGASETQENILLRIVLIESCFWWKVKFKTFAPLFQIWII